MRGLLPMEGLAMKVAYIEACASVLHSIVTKVLIRKASSSLHRLRLALVVSAYDA